MKQIRNLKNVINSKSINIENTLSVIDPYSLEEVAGIEQISSFKIKDDKIQNLPVQELFKIFKKAAVYIRKNKMELSSIAAEETGSPIKYQLEDVEAILEFLEKSEEYYISISKEYLISSRGKVALFLSANEPIILGTLPVLSALLGGNEVWVKPSSKTPSIPHILLSKLIELGIPITQLNIFFPSRELTKELLSTGFFNAVLSFGNYKTNKILSSYVANSGTQFISENEGNDWVYVDKSYGKELNLAKVICNSFIKHNGQMCDGVRGILVDEEIYQKLLLEIQDLVLKINVGDPLSENSQIGAVIFGSSEVIDDVLKDTEKNSLEVFNYKKNNNRINPTVVVEPNINSLIVSQGLFAPIVWIRPVNSIDEVIKLFREKNSYGLGFSIFSQNKSQIRKLIESIDVSRININVDPVKVSVFSPWGGIKKSGTGGPTSWIEKLSNRKLINYGKY